MDILGTAYRLQQRGEPFVLATVVRAERPTSAKAGARAIIFPDGSLEGWVGGSCAEPVVKRQARRALEEGAPRLIRLCPPEKMGQALTDGVHEIALTCVSGGTLEIYIEPHLVQPQLVIVGHLATAQALARLGAAMDFHVSVTGLDASQERFPQANQVSDSLDVSQLALGPRSYVVVASHGNYDEELLQAALESPAPYVALVASKSRAEAVLNYLEQSGVSAADRGRLKYPAGLDLGAVTPEEIAVSILAEIIQLRRAGGQPGTIEAVGQDDQPHAAEARDPVCGMMVEVESAHFQMEHNGRMYYFCAAGCMKAFERSPGDYL